MKLKDIIEVLEERIPPAWSEEWDNTGLLVGDPCSDIQKIGLVLDVTEASVSKAADLGCRLLISHHPAIFRPLRKITSNSPAGKTLLGAIRGGISLYALHTNWDISPEGVNVILAALLGLNHVRPLMPADSKDGAWGLGAVGRLPTPISFGDLLKQIKKRWSLSSCTGYEDASEAVSLVALGGGACGDMWTNAADAGASVFVTSDMAYHSRQDALNSGLMLVDTDHGETERTSLPGLAKLIKELSGLDVVMIPEVESEKFSV